MSHLAARCEKSFFTANLFALIYYQPEKIAIFNGDAISARLPMVLLIFHESKHFLERLQRASRHYDVAYE